MIGKAISAVQESDIQRLLDLRIPESKTIEYKKELGDLQQGKVKKEFLADISSFANCLGGDLIFGVAEDGGVPIAIPGFPVADEDALRLQIEEICQHGIAPRIARFEMKFLPICEGHFVLVVRVSRSWLAPHMVWFEKNSKFYSRNSAGKYQLDHHEIKAAFENSGSGRRHLDRFREERIAYVLERKNAILNKENIGLLVHLVPLASIVSSFAVDLQKIERHAQLCKPLGDGGGWNSSFNFEGYISFRGQSRVAAHSSLQVFRNGCLEYVRIIQNAGVPLESIEGLLAREVENIRNLLGLMEVPPPVFLCITVLNVLGKGAFLPHEGYISTVCESPHLALPEVGIESIQEFDSALLRHPCDVLWNAFGYPRSQSFDGSGQYRKK